jgi:CHAT domain-containing protein
LVAGEGVLGFRRAFHFAGCQNVIASLWKVSDEATCALMVLFYRYLWEENLPPIQALRKAQLALYHNPGTVKSLSNVRGPNLKEVDPGKSPAKVKHGGKAHPKSWAGFTISGIPQPKARR